MALRKAAALQVADSEPLFLPEQQFCHRQYRGAPGRASCTDNSAAPFGVGNDPHTSAVSRSSARDASDAGIAPAAQPLAMPDAGCACSVTPFCRPSY